MRIAEGTRVGLYEVTGLLGSGAMGNVYRARDPRLERDVAIKALPEGVASDPDALARFEREARFLAQLNHPNIGTIYGIEEVEGERLLVLELVPGETLEERLRRGPIPVADVIDIGRQIAAALEAAHAAEIIHRDLKPSNVKITPDGRVKLLDFGIARTTAKDSRHAESGALTITKSGQIVGTPQYMSPEQLYGEPVDRRADVWAFGCLVYEMLTGKYAFPGGSFFEVADAIRIRDPDWSALPHGIPDALRRLLMRCMKKSPADRLGDMSEVRLELDDLASGGGVATRRRSAMLTWAAAAVAVAAIVVATLTATRGSRARAVAEAPSLRLSQLTSSEGVEQFPAWSPDGASVVYSGEVGGIRKLFVKTVGSADAQQLTAGDHDDIQPTWSADGARVLFVRAKDPARRLQPGDVFGMYEDDAGVWSVDVKTRQESPVVDGAFFPDVSPDGRSIVVDASWAGPRRIWIVDARGLNPQQVTSDSSEAVTHVQPRWSPDGTRIVYQRIEKTRFDVAVVDVETRRSTVVTRDVYRKINPVWGRDGRTVYYSSDAGGGMNVWRQPLDAAGRPAGPPQQLTTGAGQDVEIALSPDGARLVYTTLHQNADLWRLPLTPEGDVAGAPERLVATTREDSRGEWSPDGARIAFNSDRAGPMNLWLFTLADRSTRQITTGAGGDFQPTWSPDGKSLVFFSSRGAKTDTDIWRVDVATGALTQLTRGRSLDLNPFYSPDGKQIVFQSDSSGRLELWVMNADGSGVRQLTTGGAMGHFIRWLPDGYVYFRSPSSPKLLRVESTGGAPEPTGAEAGSHISFSPDGSRFIDVRGHKAVWLSTVGGEARKIFEFDDADVRIDYPVWSPDGKSLLFDWFKPKEGDLWLAEGVGGR
ncbi:MAG TPA: protein kinase [Gemmatimonadaceae bacterium]|nr:protein kinase [Gemmatimonadaceae bacterium]